MLKTVLLTALALVAFAANSVLCRLALANASIDAASFTVVRLLSGIIMLWVLLLVSRQGKLVLPQRKQAKPALYLFGYMALFSFAYVSLGTGTGALILFGSVQILLMLKARAAGEAWSGQQTFGFVAAALGFVYLLWPSLSTPSVWAAIMMVGAGLCWAAYTLAGKQSVAPLLDTTRNFFFTLPLVLALALYAAISGFISIEGLVYGIVSGAIASGLGYAIWFKALPLLTTTQASVLQLLVPILAALGGVLFAAERVDLHLALSSLMVLGGVLLVIVQNPTSRLRN